jgi:excisionase family DNA binding protein
MSDQSSVKVEPFIPVIEAADRLGVHRWKLRRAVKAGLVPSYRLHNSRALVRLSEVILFIEASRHGGGDHA